MPTKDDRDFLAALGAELANDAMEMSDSEAMEGADTNALEALRTRMLAAVDEPSKRKLREARQAYNEKRAEEGRRPRSTLTRDEKKRRIERFLTKSDEAQLTLHFREGTGGIEQDIDTLFEQLVSLGMDPDDVG